MLSTHRSISRRFPVEEALRSAASKHLYDSFGRESTGFARLDQLTERRIHAENMAKIDLLLESDDPGEHCYQNLIRELDIEAENGIYLVGTEFQDDSLRHLIEDPGISGELHLEVAAIAQSLFAETLDPADDNLVRAWNGIQARYDRAHLDASVSGIVMRFLLDDAEAADDMVDALRSLLYAYHEDNVRRVSELSSLLDERELRDLVIMVAELDKRSGSYEERTRAILKRAGTG